MSRPVNGSEPVAVVSVAETHCEEDEPEPEEPEPEEPDPVVQVEEPDGVREAVTFFTFGCP